MLTFHPMIARAGTLVELPRPILVFRVHDSWDFMKLKVPLRDGDQVAGHSRDPVTIAIEGRIGSHSGELRLTEAEMLETIDALREVLHVDDAEESYVLSVFEDAGTGQHRYFRECTTIRFDVDLSEKHLYSYTLSIHASDPELHSGTLP